tara:strand:- start:228 stop:515 length:288 start_codon:yes stop_codon:yes gene_type:complete
MSNNKILIIDAVNKNTFRLTILFLCLFLLLTIVVYNIYKGTKIVLPKLEDELRESSNFHLLKSMGWAILITLVLMIILLYRNPIVKYGVNHPIKI